MGQETPYPKLTPEQIQLWEADPVTKTYLKCLEWKYADVVDAAGTGAYVDSTSASVTHGMMHTAIGHQQGLMTAQNHSELFDEYGVILEGKLDAKSH